MIIKREVGKINEYTLGAQLRSKAKYVKETEQNRSFFTRE